MIGYETVFITHPDLEEDVLKTSLKKFKDLIKKAKGKVVHEHFWGRRRMAYSIANQKYGVYHIWYLEGSGTMLDELQTQFRYSDEVIRFQTVRVEDLEEESNFFSEMLKTQQEEEAARKVPKVADSEPDKDKDKDKDADSDKKESPEPVAETEKTEETPSAEKDQENSVKEDDSEKSESTQTEKTEA
jgi:small subunit ribosomal protein S6